MRTLRLIVIACAFLQVLLPGLSAQTLSPRAGGEVWASTAEVVSPLSLLGSSDVPGGAPSGNSGPTLVDRPGMPRISSDLAMSFFLERSARQATELASYSAVQLIHADLPDTRQKGEYELQRHFVAPKTLEFKALRFTGDGFVKNNVIIRLLHAEVEHIEKEEGPQTALNDANYKFKYKGVEELDGRPMHVFELKPKKKRQGLIKGRMYLDAYTGALRRVEGQMVKSPSFFVKKLEFVQDYADFGGFTFPVRVQSVAKVRIIGKTVVEVAIHDYEPVPVPRPAQTAQQPSAGSASAGEN